MGAVTEGGPGPPASTLGVDGLEEAVRGPLFRRMFLLNALVPLAATALPLGPATVSTPVPLTEAAVLTVGLAAMLVANALLLPVGLARLQRLTRRSTALALVRSIPSSARSTRMVATLLADGLLTCSLAPCPAEVP
ncbi:hypothetical protein ACWGBH_37520 [Streptomyces massasporeus]